RTCVWRPPRHHHVWVRKPIRVRNELKRRERYCSSFLTLDSFSLVVSSSPLVSSSRESHVSSSHQELPSPVPAPARMEGQDNVKHLEDCSVSNALGTWVFSVAGALLAIPVGIKRKSLAPLVFFGTTGTMLDIIMGITACEREHAERQMQLLEAQNSPNDGSLISESGGES
ncbi:hypothetical protein G4B88_012347, partial [Cannabis sativa]